MAKKLPKQLFVKHISDIENNYFSCSENSADLADDFESEIDVGVYELTSTGKLVVTTAFVPDKPKTK